MENYTSVKMDSYDEIKGEVYKMPINSGICEIYYKDGFIYFPNNFLNEKKNEYEKRKPQNNYGSYKIDNIKPCVLCNIGGVCYMNATLQCFFYCKPLTEYFLNLYDKRNLGPISKGYFDFIKGLSSGDNDAAQNFKKAMIKMDNIFFGNEGNDSKDVAVLILSELHNELKKNKKDEIIRLDRKVDNNDLNEVYKEKKELDTINGNSTIITKTFNFCMKYKQQCGCGIKCKKFSKPYYTIETDNILILELETLFKDDNINISVEDILKSYTSPKKMECPDCKKKTLYMQNKFCVLPKILILVLSRGYHNKFKCKIKFDKTLDMNDYYESIDNEDYNNTVYSLIGATFAYDWSYEGTGHTVAFCKTYQDDNYYVFNDRTTRKTKINEIYGKLPYLLFYERDI
jgi:ubiquitin C-terminal hydrolase